MAKRTYALVAPLALAMTLAACSNSSPDGAPPVVVAPTPAPTPAPSPSPSPSPTPSPTTANVTACLNQVIPVGNSPIPNLTPASLVVPDTLKIDLTKASGFPNGRRLQDPVVDIILAALFLNVNAPGQSPLTFVNLPLNPPANDRPFLATFPFAAPPQGNPPLATGTGTTFAFRTDPASSYVRVDREGQPAVATAVIGAAMKNAYNDDGPAEDLAGKYVPEIVAQLTTLHNALADDLRALGLQVCST